MAVETRCVRSHKEILKDFLKTDLGETVFNYNTYGPRYKHFLKESKTSRNGGAYGGWWPDTMQVIEPSSGPLWPNIQKYSRPLTIAYFSIYLTLKSMRDCWSKKKVRLINGIQDFSVNEIIFQDTSVNFLKPPQL
ncbi:unnamed protein product [Sphenostylis stenocarpa]|uniref:Uncharacterized protein n=1 Tax=Sphenostylis stenocarpa TaxID=92480 RepID=A0AA86V6P7_9FABA|nr:unnamed protein product [Sphenostylis stenocarpa]